MKLLGGFDKHDFGWMLFVGLVTTFGIHKGGWPDLPSTLAAALIGVGIGFVISRLTKRGPA
jgi:hypothetical protein